MRKGRGREGREGGKGGREGREGREGGEGGREGREGREGGGGGVPFPPKLRTSLTSSQIEEKRLRNFAVWITNLFSMTSVCL